MELSKIRKPIVAGQFYPASRQGLKNQIEAFVDKRVDKKEAIACMLPHAGYVYSGNVATKTVSGIKIRDKIILLGPNHTGLGVAFSIMTEGVWQTPLGEVKIDSGLASQILKHSQYLKDDPQAQAYEHSLEVELPILQYFSSDFEIVPITLFSNNLTALKQLGAEIGNVLLESNIKDSVLIVASSDLTHYEPQREAEKKDGEAIQAIIELNEDKLMEKVQRLNITMCGYAPVIAMIKLAKILGAKSARLVKYETSGDVTGDKTSVVGYAGIVIS